MRFRFALAIAATAAILVALRPAAASASTADGVGSLELTASYFQTVGRVLGQAEHARSDATRAGRPRKEADARDSPSLGSGHGNSIGYAAGGVLTLGVVAAFIFGHNGASDFIAADPPSNPGSNNDTPDSIGDPGNPAADPGTPGTPPGNPPTDPPTDLAINPPGAQPDLPVGPTTVTPEPDVLILLATGLSSMVAVSIRRRRRAGR